MLHLVKSSRHPLTLAYRYVPNVTQMPMIKKAMAKARNRKPRLRANSGPTDDTLRQWGHRANALFNVLNWKENQNKRMNWLKLGDSMLGWTEAYQKCIGTMTASDTMHAGHWWNWRRHWTRCQIDDPFAIRAGTCNSLRWILTNEQTIAWTSNVFFTRRCISDWLRWRWKQSIRSFIITYLLGDEWIGYSYRCLLALMTFDNMLFSLIWYIDHCLTYTARYHWHTTMG